METLASLTELMNHGIVWLLARAVLLSVLKSSEDSRPWTDVKESIKGCVDLGLNTIFNWAKRPQ